MDTSPLGGEVARKAGEGYFSSALPTSSSTAFWGVPHRWPSGRHTYLDKVLTRERIHHIIFVDF
jgi:hypothetical protein